MRKTNRSCWPKKSRNIAADGATHRRLREVGREVELHGADNERNPRHDQQDDPASVAEHRPDAGRRTSRTTRAPGSCAAVAPVALIVNGHDRWRRLTAPHRVREHVLERRHARPQMPHLDALGRRQREQLAARRPLPARTRARRRHRSNGTRGRPRADDRRTSRDRPASSRAARRRGRAAASTRRSARPPRCVPCPCTTTWSQVYSTSGSRCDDRIRFTLLLCARSRMSSSISSRPFGIHAVGRLVEKQQIGIVDQRLRQLDALLHAGRVGLDVAVARFAQPDVEEHLVRPLRWRRRAAGRPARRSRRRTDTAFSPGMCASFSGM